MERAEAIRELFAKVINDVSDLEAANQDLTQQLNQVNNQLNLERVTFSEAQQKLTALQAKFDQVADMFVKP